LYLQDEFTIFKNLILNAGVRYDHYSTFGSTVNQRAALIYNPFEKTTFKFLYGSAFRAPNVYELYYQSSAANQLANPNLKPEKIKTYEQIYEQYIGNNLRGTVTGFYYTIDDLIVLASDPNGLIYKNIAKVEAKGVETELEGKLENGLTGRTSYSYQEATDSATDQPLKNSPKHLAKLNVTVPLLREKVFLGIEEQFTSRRKTLAGNFAKSFYLTNLTLFSQNLLKNLELSASVYNLFDYNYGNLGGEEHALAGMDIIRQDGRVFRVKLTYRF
jgi:iron complex outermembrane receptor protein